MLSFRLTDEFIEGYADKPPQWGFGVLSEILFLRTYSRDKEGSGKERWYECVRRVVEGCYSIQKEHCKRYRLPWDEKKAQASAEEMYERIFSFKLWPAGRMLEYLGSDVVHDNNDASWLQNCAMVSTASLGKEYSKPFELAMSMLMKGVGVGFDVEGAGQLTVHEPEYEHPYSAVEVDIPDTTEGWVDSTAMLIDSYLLEDQYLIKFNYNLIRPAGSPISSGGIAPGPGPLRKLHEQLRKVLDANVGKEVTSRLIADIINLIGKAVASGGRRRSAEIIFGKLGDEEFLGLKDWNLPENAERTGPDGWAWASNNTIIRNSTDELDYAWFAKRQLTNGEPGIFNVDVARNYGRMRDGYQEGIDAGVVGLNPCGEQTLHNNEFCCLCTINAMRHDSEEDFYRSMKFAYLIGKSVTLMPTMWEESNAVQMRNRRIGLSVTGMAQFIDSQGSEELFKRLDNGYDVVRNWDRIYSSWLGVRESIKVTTIKPEGSASLLAGATPGIHFPVARTYIRRMGFNINDPKLEILKKAGYNMEPAVGDKESTMMVEIPIRLEEDVRREKDVSVAEKMLYTMMAQDYWSDNSVSCTLSFKPEEVDELARQLEFWEGRYKSLSFLPLVEAGAYPQMPYEEISDERYYELISNIQEVDFESLYHGIIEDEEREGELYCTTDKCEIGV